MVSGSEKLLILKKFLCFFHVQFCVSFQIVSCKYSFFLLDFGVLFFTFRF